VEDVEAAAKARSGPTAGPSTGVPADRADEELPPVQFSPEEAEEEPVSFYQKAAIRRVVASKHVIPHFYVTKAVRADQLVARQAAEKQSTGASLTHYIMRACAKALETFPEANRSYDRGRWIRWRVVHLGLAVQAEAGLVVAVLRDVQQRPLKWVAENTRALVDRARAGKLTGPERTNPTFTISNLGAYDVESFAAIINPPSALTLAVGSVVDTPVVEGKTVVVGRVMHLTLSCDHRVVDGVLAARFLGEVKRLLEEPGEL
jgi:pyruvate dehydrogenase E2 component (dihydrolipoamide acetyltransferase)